MLLLFVYSLVSWIIENLRKHPAKYIYADALYAGLIEREHSNIVPLLVVFGVVKRLEEKLERFA